MAYQQTNAKILKNDITINFGDNVYSTSEIINSYPWALVGVEAKATFEGTTGGIDTFTLLTKDQFNSYDCYSQSVTVGRMGANNPSGHLTINGGTYLSPASVVYVAKGTCIINGGFFFGQTGADQPAQSDAEREKYGPYRSFMLNCYDAEYKAGNAKIFVTGGKFAGFDPADNYAEGNGTNFVVSGYKSVLTDETYSYYVKDVYNTTEQDTLKTVPVYEVVPASDPREGIAGTLTLPTGE